MNEKQINKWLRKRFSPVGWTLVGYYVLMNILVSVAMLRDVIAGYLNAFIEGNDQYVPDVSALTGNAWGVHRRRGRRSGDPVRMEGQRILGRGSAETGKTHETGNFAVHGVPVRRNADGKFCLDQSS